MFENQSEQITPIVCTQIHTSSECGHTAGIWFWGGVRQQKQAMTKTAEIVVNFSSHAAVHNSNKSASFSRLIQVSVQLMNAATS